MSFNAKTRYVPPDMYTYDAYISILLNNHFKLINIIPQRREVFILFYEKNGLVMSIPITNWHEYFHFHLFIYLGFYVAFKTVQVISRRVVGSAEETSTYSSLGFCTVNCRPTASNYQLSHLRPCDDRTPASEVGGESVTTLPPWPLYFHFQASHCILQKFRHLKLIPPLELVEKAYREKQPLFLTRVLLYWYNEQSFCLKCGNTASQFFKVSDGLKQRGVLFNVYLDKLIIGLSSFSSGCKLEDKSLNHSMYADDMTVMAPSVKGLKNLITISASYTKEHEIVFNFSKTVCVSVPRVINPNICPLSAQTTHISFKYL